MASLLCLAVLLSATQSGDAAVDTLIAQLDGLPEEADADAFLRRPAMMELLALADKAAPALGRAAAASPRWSVRASAAYLLAANGYPSGNHGLVPGGYAKLLDDPHPVVRAVAAQGWVSDQAKELLTAGPVAEVARRMKLPGAFDPPDWLPDEYRRRRLDRFAELAVSGPPLEEIPEWGDLHQVRYAPQASTALGVLGREIQRPTFGHEASVRIVDLLSQARGDTPAQRGFLLKLALHVVTHEGGGHERHACPDAPALYDRIAHFAQQGLWEARDPYFLAEAVRAFSELALQGHAPSLAVLERLAREHPVEEARDWAANLLGSYARLKRSMTSGADGREGHVRPIRKAARPSDCRRLPAGGPSRLRPDFRRNPSLRCPGRSAPPSRPAWSCSSR